MPTVGDARDCLLQRWASAEGALLHSSRCPESVDGAVRGALSLQRGVLASINITKCSQQAREA